MTWIEVRKDVTFNRMAMIFLWIVLLLDCIVVHGCLRKEQQEAIKSVKEVAQVKKDLIKIKDDLSYEKSVFWKQKEIVSEIQRMLENHYGHVYIDKRPIYWREDL